MSKSAVNISFFLIFFLTSLTFATEFQVLDFQEDTMNLRGTVRQYKDMNADLCAVLRVESDVQGDLNLADVQVYHRDKESAGVYYFYVSFRERHVTFASEGYLPLTFKIPLQMGKGKVYIVRMQSVGVTPDPASELPVVIQIEPEGSTVRIDGEQLEVSGSPKLTIGEHDIEIVKSGYVTIMDKFTVNEENIFFKYSLEKPKFCIVEVLTEPSGAEVSIDGVKLQAVTPISDVYYSGHYPIKITLAKYLPVEETIYIDQSKEKNTFNYILEPNTGTIEISSEPEVNMDVSLNGKSVGKTPVTLKEQNVGEYKVSGSHEYYTANGLEITLQREDEYRAILIPDKIVGDLHVISEPEVGMTIKVNGESKGKTPLSLSNIHEGQYRITAEHELYIAEPINFTLKGGDKLTKYMKAEENFCILTVNTTMGAIVYLNNQEISELKNLRLSPQTVRLRAEKPKCETVETTLILKRGTLEIVDLYLEEQVGTIAVSVDPPDAQIELKGDAGEHYSSKGTNIFENILVGSYELEVSMKGYKTDKSILSLNPDEILRERIVLKDFVYNSNIKPKLTKEIIIIAYNRDNNKNEQDYDLNWDLDITWFECNLTGSSYGAIVKNKDGFSKAVGVEQLWWFEFDKIWRFKNKLCGTDAIYHSIVDVDNDNVNEVMIVSWGIAQGYIYMNHQLISLKNFNKNILYGNSGFDANSHDFWDYPDSISTLYSVMLVDVDSDGILEIKEKK